MALQPYGGGNSQQALALIQLANALTPEEIEKRQKEAEELDQKLRYIVEDVPDRVYHIMGSNAAAGSGEFHTYRHARRREQERLERIDEEFERRKKDQEYQEKLDKLKQEDEERTAKRRAKRQKKKGKPKSNKKAKTGEEADDSDSGQELEQKQNKTEGASDEAPQIEQADLD